MWIVYLVGGATYWLVAGEVYRVGKRDCHIVIENDRSISRTHLSIELAAPACPLLSSSPAEKQQAHATAAPSSSPLAHVGQRCASQVTSMTLIDSSTYGTVLCADGHGPRHTPCDHAAESQAVSALARCAPRARWEVKTRPMSECITVSEDGKHTQSEWCVCHYDADDGTAREAGRAEEDVPVVLEQRLRLTKGTPFHIPVQLADWRAFRAVLGNHQATLRVVWYDVKALVQDVTCEVETKLRHALAYCGVCVIDLPDAHASPQEEEQERQNSNNSDDDDDQPLTLDEADVEAAVERAPSAARATRRLPLCERYSTSARTGLLSSSHTAATTVNNTNTNTNNNHMKNVQRRQQTVQPETCASLYGEVDYYVASTLAPSITALAMLCRGVPLVAPSFFLAVRQGRAAAASPSSSSLPLHKEDALSDVAQHLPALHTSWSLLTDYLASAVHETIAQSAWQPLLLTPQPRRRDLFAAWRFVVFQRGLYEEVRQYLPFTRALVCYVADLQRANEEAGASDARQSVILYSETEAPFAAADASACEQAAAIQVPPQGVALPWVEYAELMYCLLTVNSLQTRRLRCDAPAIAIAPTGAADDADKDERRASTRTSDGRRTEADPLFPDVASRRNTEGGRQGHRERDAADADGVSGQQGSEVVSSDRCVTSGGWITRHAVTDTRRESAAERTAVTAAVSSVIAAAGGDASARKEVGWEEGGTRELPAYPCFLRSSDFAQTDLGNDRSNSSRSGHRAALALRPFKKQKIAHGGPCVELVPLEPAVGAGEGIGEGSGAAAARVPRVEAMDLLSEHVTMGPGRAAQQATRSVASVLPPRRSTAIRAATSHTAAVSEEGTRHTANAAAARFNSYDVAIHHALHRRRTTRHMAEHTSTATAAAAAAPAREARERRRPTAPSGAPQRMAMRAEGNNSNDDEEEDVVIDEGGDSVANRQAGGPHANKGRRMYNVFDIDGLF